MRRDAAWETLFARWPNRDASRFVETDGITWHVQVAGDGPAILLLHGTAGATHSWRHVLPALATRYRVIAPDLPGHGLTLTSDPETLDLRGMTGAVRALLSTVDERPALLVGHSAGAAVALDLTAAGFVTPRAIVGINPALVTPPSLYEMLVAPWLAPIVTSREVAHFVAGLAGRAGRVDRLLRSTGSTLPEEQLDIYRVLAASAPRVQRAMIMMARWDVAALVRELPGITVPCTLVAGGRDHWIPLDALRLAAAQLPHATLVVLDDRGHLIPDEEPAAVVRIVRDVAG